MASALTAEQLMRSRYSAFVCEDVPYLLDTWHPDTRPTRLTLPDHNWTGLEIKETHEGRSSDKVGTVTFVASYERKGRAATQREVSQFERIGGMWFYVDGQI